jgi:ATP-dependent Clp protease ATP-binding subunit ClpA
LPQTPGAKKVIQYAIEEARRLNHNYVGTEHLLLGLLCEQDGIAAQVLANLGVRLDAVRNEIRELLGPGSSAPPEGSVKKFIFDGAQLLFRAQSQAAAEGNPSLAAQIHEIHDRLLGLLGSDSHPGP